MTEQKQSVSDEQTARDSATEPENAPQEATPVSESEAPEQDAQSQPQSDDRKPNENQPPFKEQY